MSAPMVRVRTVSNDNAGSCSGCREKSCVQVKCWDESIRINAY